MGKIGRPRGKKRGPTTSLVSDQDIEEWAERHPEINRSQIYRSAMRVLMPNEGIDERIEKIEEEIDELNVSLAAAKSSLEQLKREKAKKDAIQLEIKLEEDCHAYYLAKIIREGKIKVVTHARLTQEQMIAAVRKEYGDDAILMKDGSPVLNAEAVRRQKGDLYRDVLPRLARTYGISTPSSSDLRLLLDEDFFEPHLSLDWKRFEEAYHIRIGKFDKFEKDFISGHLSDISLEVLKGYDLQVWDTVKIEMKDLMRAEYAGRTEVRRNENA
jgi:hypothetical protein